MATIDIKTLLPANISTDFWDDFCDAWSEELILKETELVNSKEYYYNTRYQETISDLINICNTFGYYPDRSLDESVSYMQKEVKWLNYRVKYKSTYTGYNIIFNIIGYSGLVYNLYLENNLDLIRGLNLTEVVTNLDAHDYSLPFTQFTPEYYYSTIEDNSALDLGNTLDTGGTLDLEYQSFPTHHMAVEWTINKLIEENSEEYWITTAYLNYLDNAVEYNRKITEVPHSGFQFNFITDLSYTYNNLSGDANYSVPDLKMQCAYLNSNEANTNLVSLDTTTSEDRFDLDSIVLDSLDQNLITSEISGNLENDFYKIILGDGRIGLPSINFPDINNDLLAYWCFNGSSSTFIDTAGSYDGTLFGDYTREYNMLNKGVTFNGEYECYGESTNITLDNSDKTFSFWFRFDKTAQDTSITSFVLTTLNSGRTNIIFQVGYNGSSELLEITIGSFTQTTTLGLDGKLSHIVINIDKINNISNFYINGTLLAQVDITGLATMAGDHDLTIGQSTIMSIDEIRIYDKSLSTDEMEFLYTNQVASSESINVIFETTELINTRQEDVDWYIIAGRIRFDRDTTDDDQDEEVTITEFVIENSVGAKVFYAHFPPAIFQKKYHCSYQLYIKK